MTFEQLLEINLGKPSIIYLMKPLENMKVLLTFIRINYEKTKNLIGKVKL
jgi:hypothetical protein